MKFETSKNNKLFEHEEAFKHPSYVVELLLSAFSNFTSFKLFSIAFSTLLHIISIQKNLPYQKCILTSNLMTFYLPKLNSIVAQSFFSC